MYMSAMVRYFALIGPRSQSQDRWWPDLSYEYLVAFRRGFEVRLIPIGFAHFQTHDPAWKHWEAVSDCMQVPVSERPLNVVCCPAGIETGRQMKRGNFLPANAPPIENADEIVYEPGYALGHYWTEGLRNIAITGTAPKAPNNAEIAALKRYDTVITPAKKDAIELLALGVSAFALSPEELTGDVAEVLAMIDGRGDA
jgi:hypothetical protein